MAGLSFLAKGISNIYHTIHELSQGNSGRDLIFIAKSFLFYLNTILTESNGENTGTTFSINITLLQSGNAKNLDAMKLLHLLRIFLFKLFDNFFKITICYHFLFRIFIFLIFTFCIFLC